MVGRGSSSNLEVIGCHSLETQPSPSCRLKCPFCACACYSISLSLSAGPPTTTNPTSTYSSSSTAHHHHHHRHHHLSLSISFPRDLLHNNRRRRHTSLLSAQVPLLTLPLSPEAPHPFHIHLLCSVLALFCCQLLLLHHFRLHSSPLFNSAVRRLLLHPFTVVPGIQTVILSTHSLFRQRVPV